METILSYLDRGCVLIADGATGTVFQNMGLEPGSAPELWNVERPDAVRAHHRAYLDAGAQVILTNTFGGCRLKLDRMSGLGDRVAELNRMGAELARLEAGGEAYVAGDIGPTGELMSPYGSLGYYDAVEVFYEQAAALVGGGADLLWIETMSDLDEAAAAVDGARRAAGDRPVFCTMSYAARGRTVMGVKPSQMLERLLPMGVSGVGANCGDGIEPVLAALEEMRACLSTLDGVPPVLIAKPNAGLPRLEKGQTVFDLGPQEMSKYVDLAVELGAQIVGGCCGSTPEHIAAIAARVAEIDCEAK